jgi:F-box protein 11
MLTGKPFCIYQDRKDHAWGENWKKRIRQGLDKSTFLIVVVTPSYLASDACRSEFAQFLKKETKLGRDDRILPILYVETETVTDEALRDKDDVAKVIAARQWFDWRRLRFEPWTNPEVPKTATKMAERIRDVLRDEERGNVQQGNVAKRAVRQQRRKIALAKQGGGANVAEARDTVVAASTSNALVSLKEPLTLVVDPMPGRSQFNTITSAVDMAPPGARILVRPGLYKEGIVPDKPLEIVGDGPLEEIQVEASGKGVILFKTEFGRVSNLTLRQRGGGDWPCVDITQGRLELEGCDISSESSACVAVHDGADPRVRRNRIHDGKRSGVFVYQKGLGTFEDNDIFGNVLAGVGVSEESNPTFRRNRVHDGKSGGVFVHAKAAGTFEDNDIFGNGLSGVEVKGESNPTFRRNRVHDGKTGGVLVHAKAAGTFEDNDIFGNVLAGVGVSEEGNPTFRRNRIHDGQQSGVFVYTEGRGVYEENEITRNNLGGVLVQEKGEVVMKRNRINTNGNHGVRIATEGTGTFEENDLRDNELGPWQIEDACLPNVKKVNNIE